MKLEKKLEEHTKDITDVMILSTIHGLVQHLKDITNELNLVDKTEIVENLKALEEVVLYHHKETMEKEV